MPTRKMKKTTISLFPVEGVDNDDKDDNDKVSYSLRIVIIVKFINHYT